MKCGLTADAMVVSVREGRVRVTSPTTSIHRRSRTSAALDDGGRARPAARSPPPILIGIGHSKPRRTSTSTINRSRLFLQWIARETGRHLVYSTPQAEAAAQNGEAAWLHRGPRCGCRIDDRARDHCSCVVIKQTQARSASSSRRLIRVHAHASNPQGAEAGRESSRS